MISHRLLRAECVLAVGNDPGPHANDVIQNSGPVILVVSTATGVDAYQPPRIVSWKGTTFPAQADGIRLIGTNHAGS